MTRISDNEAMTLASEGWSNYQIASRLLCDESTVRRALVRGGFKRHLLPLDLTERYHFNIDRPIVLQDIDAMVTADWHVPIYNPALVNEMIETALRWDIDKLIIGGDLFNFDSLSHYDPKQIEAGLEREVEEAQKIMRVLMESFSQIIFVWGNHDARMHRALGYKTQFASAMRWLFGELGSEALEKLLITNLDHMVVEFSDQEYPWRICHPQNYSRIPLSTPRVLAAKHNSNIICAHAHHAAIGYATDGLKTVAEAGGLFDQHKTSYLQRSTTFPTWTPGYGWFKDGHFRMTTPHWSVS